MSDVKRYEIGGERGVFDSTLGDFVSYDDYKALASRLQDAQLAYDKASRSIVSKALLAERDDYKTRFEAVWERAQKLDAAVGERDARLNEQGSRLGRVRDLIDVLRYVPEQPTISKALMAEYIEKALQLPDVERHEIKP